MTQAGAERADPGGARGLTDPKSRLRLPTETVLGIALMIPALATIIGLIGYPTLYAIWISLHTKLLAVRDMPFVGLENYVTVLSQGQLLARLGPHHLFHGRLGRHQGLYWHGDRARAE